jgi:hypothetical protein
MRVDHVLISADEHAQTSVSLHGDRHSLGPPGARRGLGGGAEAVRRVAQCGSATIRHQNPSSPGAARKVSARCGELAFRTPT